MWVSIVKFRQSCSDWNKDSPSNSDGLGKKSFILSNKETCVNFWRFRYAAALNSSPVSAEVFVGRQMGTLLYNLLSLRRQVKMEWIVDDPKPSKETFPIAESTNSSHRV